MPTVESCRVPDLSLRAPEGEPIPISAVSVRAVSEGEHLVALRVELTLSQQAWARVDREALFHLDPDARGPVFGGSFEPREVEIEARLDASLLPKAAQAYETIFHLGALLLEEGPFSATESWYALNVKQAHGPIKLGMATRWANEG
ncbi:MAG: hypothetical protein ABIO70_25035 [Pseudomonadota bacterium]